MSPEKMLQNQPTTTRYSVIRVGSSEGKQDLIGVIRVGSSEDKQDLIGVIRVGSSEGKQDLIGRCVSTKVSKKESKSVVVIFLIYI